MQFLLRPLVVLLALVSVLNNVTCVPVEDDKTATQIESPLKVDLLGLEELEHVDDLEDLDETEEFDYQEGVRKDEADDEEAGQEDGEEGQDEEEDQAPLDFDVDYIVKRPTSSDQKPETDCKPADDEGGEDGEICERPVKDVHKRKPYEKYRGYATWERRPLFIIIIGGLRWDYLNPSFWNVTGKMKAFSWIKKHGTMMKQVVPVFPPYDLPTWTSMATGLYPKSTGVTGDYMYNLKSRTLFSRGESLDGWWINGEPIWSIAAKNNRKVSVLNWHDCTLPGMQIEDQVDCKPFVPNSPIPTKRKLIQLFNQAFTKIHAESYDMSIVYTDIVKKTALTYGPNSPEVMEALSVIDDVLQGRLSDIKNKKERANLKLNILLLSDYGLNSRVNTTKLVLDDYVDFEHVQYIIQRGGSTVLVPYALKAGAIMHGVGDKLGVSTMAGVDAFVRDVNLEVPPIDNPTIPDDLNYAGHTWTQDILLLAKPGFEIEIKEANEKLLPLMDPSNEMGTSGYHPNPSRPHIVPGRDKHKSKELRAREKVEGDLYNRFAHMMKTVGFAWGPDFKSGHETESVEIVDIYQIMCFLLQVDPNEHSGSWDRVKSMLVLSSGDKMLPPLYFILVTSALNRLV